MIREYIESRESEARQPNKAYKGLLVATGPDQGSLGRLGSLPSALMACMKHEDPCSIVWCIMAWHIQ